MAFGIQIDLIEFQQCSFIQIGDNQSMYFPDMTHFLETGTLAVGWLEQSHPFTRGETTDEFRERLFLLCMKPVRQTRGFHVCDLCSLTDNSIMRATLHSEEAWLGSAEIRVSDGDIVYAAPTLIYHYVTEHSYRPPDKFIEAVLA